MRSLVASNPIPYRHKCPEQSKKNWQCKWWLCCLQLALLQQSYSKQKSTHGPCMVLLTSYGFFTAAASWFFPPTPPLRAGVWCPGFGGVWRPCTGRSSHWHQGPGPPRGRYQGRDAGRSSCPECPQQAGKHLAPSTTNKAEDQGSLSMAA